MSPASVTSFVDHGEPSIRGFLHEPDNASGPALVLTHGAGGNCESKLLVAVAGAFAEAGFVVLRFNLPFRQQRPFGPPSPGSAERDRAGLRRAVGLLREKVAGTVYLGGHSYGGRQASMLVANEPGLASGLVLLSYPLHPPRRPEQLRTAHFPKLNVPALFVHGSRDPFGSIDEMKAALSLIPARHSLLPIEGAGHELLSAKNKDTLAQGIVQAFGEFAGLPSPA
jgi:predicted alpha/beta-hydrolase family hydrolase